MGFNVGGWAVLGPWTLGVFVKLLRDSTRAAGTCTEAWYKDENFPCLLEFHVAASGFTSCLFL